MAFAESVAFESSRVGTVLLEDWVDSESGPAQGPERALMSALLFDGVITCLNYAGCTSASGQRRFRETFAWVSSADTEYVFSFHNVCECLGINPDGLRLGLINACNSKVAASRKKSRRNF
jgi:hypothetical protein